MKKYNYEDAVDIIHNGVIVYADEDVDYDLTFDNCKYLCIFREASIDYISRTHVDYRNGTLSKLSYGDCEIANDSFFLPETDREVEKLMEEVVSLKFKHEHDHKEWSNIMSKIILGEHK